MSVFRFIAITLPMTLLAACGGGGGGTTAMTEMPMTMTPGTGYPIMPPISSNPQTLPSYLITNLPNARANANGEDISLTREQIVQNIRTRASTANLLDVGTVYLEGSDGFQSSGQNTPNCSGTSCSVTLSDIGSIVFSLDEIYGPALINDAGLEGYNVEVQAVMTDNGATVIQGRGAARGDGGTPFTFQTYGGWLGNGGFGMEQIEVTAATTATHLTAYSFGGASGTNPTGTSSAVWSGIAVAWNRSGFLRHGEATIDIDDFQNPSVDASFSLVDIADSGLATSTASWSDMPLIEGTFTDANGQIRGTFYGDNHEGVGGTFSDTNFVGAFGATRQ